MVWKNAANEASCGSIYYRTKLILVAPEVLKLLSMRISRKKSFEGNSGIRMDNPNKQFKHFAFASDS